ncbi:ADP-ribosylglycohydrolase family protein [Georgenia subflava]|uniref:ADP-ribosylglycohydrolase family protein n=1 Tax=Georgenia subflava TaxID=1622177 RepID=A0A6N7EH20_9MICO|nr:ADP-ribosylglycohydrolase family protein [Georgenia subflava]MPV36278.1 ADP-ribosylglycohydrolase family protein [Georgenia subflava]
MLVQADPSTLPAALPAAYPEQVYAGVLGKILGVYHGRPVEGWAYEDIQERFGDIHHYVAADTGWPLIVPDDDISGTFVFFRALEDNLDRLPLTADMVGDSWLNYIIENRTVLWWGGLSRSTEHTAYLRLKSGLRAPASGAISLNGPSMAEQIGAQIFIDTWALVNPDDPERAVAMARAAASVSHDGLAVEAASLLVAMESMAFAERDAGVLLDRATQFVADPRLLRIVDDVREQCARTDDWRVVRDWIETHHGYDHYPSNSPAATNHAAILMALLMGGEDWQRASMIITSAGWDTDSNAGNLGCLNGIRLGLEGLDAGSDFRGPVADRMYVVSADGGECLSDAVRETRRIVRTAAAMRGAELADPKRFAFELPGSVQGFRSHPDLGVRQACTSVSNEGDGLAIAYRSLGAGTEATVCVDTWVEPAGRGVAGTSYFEVVGSPSLYPTQHVTATVRADADAPALAFFIESYGDDGVIRRTVGDAFALVHGENQLRWTVPGTDGRPIFRLGLRLTSAYRTDGAVTLVDLDWTGAPEDLLLGRSYELTPGLTPWTTDTAWLRSFVSSATNLAPDYTTTMCVSHSGRHGLVTTGTRDWNDYSVSSRIEFNQNDGAGLVARSRGHRRYYAAIMRGRELQILRVRDTDEAVLAATQVDHETDQRHDLEFRVSGRDLSVVLDGEQRLSATDDAYVSGGAGFVMNEGAMLVDGFRVRRIPR